MAQRNPAKAHREDFDKRLAQLADKRTPWETYRNFCEMGYCAVAKPVNPHSAEPLEKRYMDVANTYKRPQLDSFASMLALVQMELSGEHSYQDFLGTVYEESGFCSTKWGGQFMTPWALAQTMARITIQPRDDDPEVVLLGEPACGSGRMIIAAAEVLDNAGRNVAERLWVDATDKDRVCQQMTYLQMAALNIPGVVRHGNSLSMEMFDSALTPAGMVLYSSSRYLRGRLAGERLEPVGGPQWLLPLR